MGSKLYHSRHDERLESITIHVHQVHVGVVAAAARRLLALVGVLVVSAGLSNRFGALNPYKFGPTTR